MDDELLLVVFVLKRPPAAELLLEMLQQFGSRRVIEIGVVETRDDDHSLAAPMLGFAAEDQAAARTLPPVR